MWRDTLPERLVRDHEQPLITPPVEVFCMTTSSCMGQAGSRKRGTSFSSLRSIRATAGTGTHATEPTTRPGQASPARRAPSTARLAHHSRQLPCIRPLAYRGHAEAAGDRGIPEALARLRLDADPDALDLPEFVHAHTRTLLPHVPIVTYDPQTEYIRCERMFMPTWGTDHVFSAWVGERVDHIRSETEPLLPKRIFVSRSPGR